VKKKMISRRSLLATGTCTAVAAAAIPEIVGANAQMASDPKGEMLARKYYGDWEKKDWHSLDLLLTDDFTFSSPVDDHISKSAYKTGCWDTQIAYTGRFDLTHVFATGNEALVMYVGHTSNGKTFQNVEYLQFKGEQVQAVKCYFGGHDSFPSATSKKQ
jgi:SnoaL-like domain